MAARKGSLMQNTQTRVDVPRQSYGMYGKPEAFSPEEMKVLHARLKQLKEDRSLTQEAVGQIVGIAQQNAGRILRTGTGMARPTANRLAVALGYRDAEALLLDAGVFSGMKAPPSDQTWGHRDTAIRLARSAGYDEAAIQAVVARHTTGEARTRPIKWWMWRFSDEDRELAAERGIDPVPTTLPEATSAKRRVR